MKLGIALLSPNPPPGVWLLCGPPASGKSTFRKEWWAGPVVSPDELRWAITGTAFDPRKEGVVWARATREVKRHLVAPAGVLLDATNLTRTERRRWVKAAQEAGRPAYAIACYNPERLPVDALLRRNAERQHSVPEERVRALAAAWEPPARAEGFDGVWEVLH